MLRDQHREKLLHFFFLRRGGGGSGGRANFLKKCRDRRLSFFKGVGRSFQISVAMNGVDYLPGSVFHINKFLLSSLLILIWTKQSASVEGDFYRL